jgi:hypothetical protein
MKKNKYKFPCSIEYEYNTPEGSDVVTEVKKCVEYRKIPLALRISYLIGGGVSYGSYIDALDYRTGEVVWRHANEGSAGLLSTAGGLFSGDGQSLVAYEAKTGKPLWHSASARRSPPEEINSSLWF